MNNIIPSVEKTIQLLLALSGGGTTQAELSKRLRITMSTTYRILTTLQDHDWIRKDGSEYFLSAGLIPLLGSLSPAIDQLEVAKKEVDRISGMGIACKLSIRKDAEQLTYYRAEPPGPVALTGHTGSTFPIFEGSVGAALLCEEAEPEIRDMIAKSSADIPEVKNPELVLNRIEEIRRKGTVLNVMKNRWNIAACSIPLYNEFGRVFAALTLIGSQDDFAGKKRSKRDTVLKQAAKNIKDKTMQGDKDHEKN